MLVCLFFGGKGDNDVGDGSSGTTAGTDVPGGSGD